MNGGESLVCVPGPKHCVFPKCDAVVYVNWTDACCDDCINALHSRDGDVYYAAGSERCEEVFNSIFIHNDSGCAITIVASVWKAQWC